MCVEGGLAEKVSIAVVSSHGAVCWGELGAAVEKSSAAATVASARDRRGDGGTGIHRKQAVSHVDARSHLQGFEKK